MHNHNHKVCTTITRHKLDKSNQATGTIHSLQATGTIHNLLYHRYRPMPVTILTSTEGNQLLRARSALRMPTT